MGFAETFKALSDPVRREILVLLKDGKLSAGEIAGCFAQSHLPEDHRHHQVVTHSGGRHTERPRRVTQPLFQGFRRQQEPLSRTPQRAHGTRHDTRADTLQEFGGAEIQARDQSL